MAGSTGFFDAARQYTAQEFARALRAASTPGVVQGIGNQYAVTAGPGLGVTIDSGFVTILGDWRYEDAPTALALLAADLTNPRKDRIIARLTISTKTVEITKLTGTPAGSPIVPSLTQGSDVYEIPLYWIDVPAGASSIVSGNVHDERQYSGAVLSDHKHTGTAGGGGTLGRGTSTASGATITVPTDGKTIPITGTTTITSINAGAVGREVTLEFQSAGCQVTSGSNLKLVSNYLSTVQGTLSLESDGTNWIERGRTPVGSGWAAWTPDSIVQSGVVAFTSTRCRYTQVGKLMTVQFQVAFTGAGTAANNILLNLPSNLAAPASGWPVGVFQYFDASVGNYVGSLYLFSAMQLAGMVHSNPFQSFGVFPNFAIASTDQWSGTATYEVA